MRNNGIPLDDQVNSCNSEFDIPATVEGYISNPDTTKNRMPSNNPTESFSVDVDIPDFVEG